MEPVLRNICALMITILFLRFRKFYEPEDDGFLNRHESPGRYGLDHQVNVSGFSDIRNNVPGEPGIDYPSYTRLPQTGFHCEAEFRGYYADKAAGCQVFHVCDGNVLVSSFLCPVGSIFSQKLLTCDWWSKVDCLATGSYEAINTEGILTEIDDNEILRKVAEMTRVQSPGERIPAQTVSQLAEPQRRHGVLNYGSIVVTQRSIDLQAGPDNSSDYPDYPSWLQPRFQLKAGQKSRERYQEDDYYRQDVNEENQQRSILPIRSVVRERTFRNKFQPSYAPTVPTVITTTRRFYSPTFLTTYRPSTEHEVRGRFDLEFESSDHPYTARGRPHETVKTYSIPSTVTKKTTATGSISFPILVNNDVEWKYDIENMQKSESPYYIPTVTLPAVQANATEAGDSAKAIVSKHYNRGTDEITETLSILTCDDEVRNPEMFAYNRKEETSPRIVTFDKDFATIREVNSPSTSSIEGHKKTGKLTVFIEPPLEIMNQFHKMVLEESSIPKSHQETFKSKGLDENNSHSAVQIIESIKIPDIHITPLLFNVSGARGESRLHIFANKDNNNNNSKRTKYLTSNNLNPMTEKIASTESMQLVEDSEGVHSETMIISEKMPKEEEETVQKLNENKNSRSDTETPSMRLPSDDATSANTNIENVHSIEEINAALAPVEYNSTAFEDKYAEDYKISEEFILNKNATDAEQKNDENNKKNEAFFLKSNMSVSKEKNYEDVYKSSGIRVMLSRKTVSQEKSNKKSSAAIARLVHTKATMSGETSADGNKSDEILAITKMTTYAEKNGEDYKKRGGSEETLNTNISNSQGKRIELPVGSETIILHAKTMVPKEKLTKDSDHTIDIEKALINANSTISDDKLEYYHEHSIGSENGLSVKKTVSHEKSLELSIGRESILLDCKTIIPKDKKSDDRSISSEESIRNADTTVSKETISADHEHLFRSKETLLTAITTNLETRNNDDHEQSSRSDKTALIGGHLEDSMVEGSSPSQVTATVNEDEAINPNGEVIRKFISKQDIDDSVAATEYRGFEIIKSDEPGVSKDLLEDPINAAASIRDSKINSESDISEEKISYYRSNTLLPRNYYRNIVSLLNGPNMPRPFSLEPSRNVVTRTPPTINDVAPSMTVPLPPTAFGNDLTSLPTGIPAHATLHSIASSFNESEELNKSSLSTKDDRANSKTILNRLSQTVGEQTPNAYLEKIIFDLPQGQRSLDFKSGEPLGISQQTNTRDNEKSTEFKTTQRSNDNSFVKTVVETEFIPSISFSLNTDDEREEYMDAVVKGLLADVQATKTTYNDTNSSFEC